MMIEKMKGATIKVLRDDWALKGTTSNGLDIVRESSNLFIKLVLTCLFGEASLEAKVKHRHQGKDTWLSLGEAILTQVERAMGRGMQPHLRVLSELHVFNLTALDREIS
jgi:hypothetical protein